MERRGFESSGEDEKLEGGEREIDKRGRGEVLMVKEREEAGGGGGAAGSKE